MFHREFHTFVFACSSAFLIVQTAWAQNQTLTLTSTVVQAQDATVYQQPIHDFVAGQVEKLKSDNPEIQKVARDALASKAEMNGASPSFLEQYGDALNQLLVPLAGDKRIRVRLNAAIVNGRVAAKANNARQLDSTLAFMKDTAAPVVIWGLKAAKYEIPALIQLPPAARNDTLTGAIIPAVKAHADGPVTEEAYQALTLDTITNFQTVTPEMIKAVLPRVMEIFEFRLGLYQQQPPESPLAENQANLFLIKTKVWTVETAQQHAQAVKLMSALLAAAMQAAPAAQPPMKDDLMNIVRLTGKCFVVVGQITNNAKLRDAGSAVAEINDSTDPADRQRRREALNAGLQDAKLVEPQSGTTSGTPDATTTVSN